MESWKTRTLMLLTTIAMVLAISMPVAAQTDSCPPWDENCDSQSDSCAPWDENCDPQSDSWDDHSDNGLVDTYGVGGARCLVTYDPDDGGIDEEVCFDKDGKVVWEA